MKKILLVTAIGMVVVFGAIAVSSIENDVSASGYCPESKDGSQANPGCVDPTQSRGECNSGLAGGHKDFECVKQPEPPCNTPSCPVP